MELIHAVDTLDVLIGELSFHYFEDSERMCKYLGISPPLYPSVHQIRAIYKALLEAAKAQESMATFHEAVKNP